MIASKSVRNRPRAVPWADPLGMAVGRTMFITLLCHGVKMSVITARKGEG